MNTEQQAAQLELAAQILRTGHPWEINVCGCWRKPTLNHETSLWCVAQGFEIRPILATPPDGRKLHNPLGLTAEQVGVGYRLTLEEEMDENQHGDVEGWRELNPSWIGFNYFWTQEMTIRVPLSTPWPEAKPDPYTELKKAHAEGKVIQKEERHKGSGSWIACPHPIWILEPERYRIKPWAMPESPSGRRWHKPEALTQTDWEAGWRPGCLGERMQTTDEFFHFREGWVRHNSIHTLETTHLPFRTKRPLPIDKELVWVPLEAQDVPPGSVIRGAGETNEPGWCMIVSATLRGVRLWRSSDCNQDEILWERLMENDSEILRPGQTEWQPCRKEAK